MQSSRYLDIFDENRAAILAAAELGLDNDVDGCPGWDVGTLVAHCGAAYTFWNKWIRDRPINGRDQQSWVDLQAERSRRLPGVQWHDSGFPKQERPPGVIEFAREIGDELAGRLRELEPSEEVWTIFTPNQTVGFIRRRLAHETAIHRWDVENANGLGPSIPLELAADGLDEYLTVVLQVISQHEPIRPTRTDYPVRAALQPLDESDPWLVTFNNDRVSVTRGAHSANIVISASTEQLLLYVWGRLSASTLMIEGDATLADQWPMLVGTF